MRPISKVPKIAAFGHFSKELLIRQNSEKVAIFGLTFKSQEMLEIQVKLTDGCNKF